MNSARALLGYRSLLALTLSIPLLGGVGTAHAQRSSRKNDFVPSGGWEGYLVDKKGNPHAIRHPLERNDDKDWFGLRFTEYRGPRATVAVFPVENQAAETARSDYRRAEEAPGTAAVVPVASIEDLLTTALSHTHRVDLVEREQIEKVLSEQDFQASSYTGQRAVQAAQNLGADYLLLASVNEWVPDLSTIGGPTGKILDRVGGNRRRSEIVMSFRLVSSTTGSAVFSTTERASITSWDVSIGSADDEETDALRFGKESPINVAVQSCIHKAIYKLVHWIADRPWSAQIVNLEGSKIYINAGSENGMTEGTLLDAYSLGQEIFDKVNRVSLGQESGKVGLLRIVSVADRYSVASVVEGCQGLKPGDEVRLRQ
jgi:curli biogenesis system outer membrane secretion channel CsgG